MKGVLHHVKKQHHTQQRLEEVLGRVLDAETRKYICVKHIRESTVVLSAGSSAALYNASLKKTELLRAVKQLIPEIEDIVIKVN